MEVETPLFHNNLLPDLIQVNFLPNSTVDAPNTEHLPPAFIAALAGDGIGIIRLEINIRGKARFINTLSHDLRTYAIDFIKRQSALDQYQLMK